MTEWLSTSLFYGAVISIIAYEAGLMIRRRFKLAVLNPLLLAVIIVIGLNAILGIDYEAYNGGAQYLSYLLTPTTVCLAVPMYEQLTLLKENWKAVVSGLVAGVVSSMASVWALSVLFGLDHTMYVTLLPKSMNSLATQPDKKDLPQPTVPENRRLSLRAGNCSIMSLQACTAS